METGRVSDSAVAAGGVAKAASGMAANNKAVRKTFMRINRGGEGSGVSARTGAAVQRTGTGLANGIFVSSVNRRDGSGGGLSDIGAHRIGGGR